MKLCSKKEAIESGVTRYFTGVPCKHGHVSERLTRSSQCIACNKEGVRRWLATDRGRELYRAACRRGMQKRRRICGAYALLKEYRKTDSGRRISREAARRYQNKTANRQLAASLRQRLSVAIRNHAKAGSAVNDLGCSIDELIKHIEMQFHHGWTWDKSSWGPVWQIDHIKPLATFDLFDREQFLAANHWSNLRPYPSNLNAAEGARR